MGTRTAWLAIVFAFGLAAIGCSSSREIDDHVDEGMTIEPPDMNQCLGLPSCGPGEVNVSPSECTQERPCRQVSNECGAIQCQELVACPEDRAIPSPTCVREERNVHPDQCIDNPCEVVRGQDGACTYTFYCEPESHCGDFAVICDNGERIKGPLYQCVSGETCRQVDDTCTGDVTCVSTPERCEDEAPSCPADTLELAPDEPCPTGAECESLSACGEVIAQCAILEDPTCDPADPCPETSRPVASPFDCEEGDYCFLNAAGCDEFNYCTAACDIQPDCDWVEGEERSEADCSSDDIYCKPVTACGETKWCETMDIDCDDGPRCADDQIRMDVESCLLGFARCEVVTVCTESIGCARCPRGTSYNECARGSCPECDDCVPACVPDAG